MLGPTKNVGPVGSVVFSFIGHKRTNRHPVLYIYIYITFVQNYEHFFILFEIMNILFVIVNILFEIMNILNIMFVI